MGTWELAGEVGSMEREPCVAALDARRRGWRRREFLSDTFLASIVLWVVSWFVRQP
jgi:hypothetical protein